MSFRALLLEENEGAITASVTDLDDHDLPTGNVTVDVEYSSVNYKDGMILEGIGRLVRTYPHVPGVDLAGVVAESSDDRYRAGDAVILTGWRVGERHWGGFAQRARVDADWLVPVPAGMTTRRAMAFGTAGLTSALAVTALEAAGLTTDRGQVLVTGAGGGLGGVAVRLLADSGYDVAASTGRASEHDRLRALGANEIIERSELSVGAAKPLMSERWAACVDAVGGATMDAVLAQIRYGGSLASCGNTGGNELDTTVLPFLLRGVNVLGVDSVMCPFEQRIAGWQRLVTFDGDVIDGMVTEIGLDDLVDAGRQILDGRIAGRVVVATG